MGKRSSAVVPRTDAEREAIARAAAQTENTSTTPAPPSPTVPATGGTFDRLDTQLDPEDLNDPGAQKMVLRELTETQKENRELKEEKKSINEALETLRDKYHAADKDVATLTTKAAKQNGWEILGQASFVGAGLLFGVALSNSDAEIKRITAILGLVMLIGPIAASWLPGFLLRSQKPSK
jgi:ElaB/YqjD/DUF883 family membrane-anchored ribosome-binding protein